MKTSKEKEFNKILNFFKKPKTQLEVIGFTGCIYEANRIQNELLNSGYLKGVFINGYLYYKKTKNEK